MRLVRHGLAALLAALPLWALSPSLAFADDMYEEETEEVDEESEEADDEVADDDPSAVTVYRAELEPHGRWVVDPGYGTVWVPNASVVGADFAPYQTGGRWELTSDGDWLWVSDYSWGYIPFHYGRWVYVQGLGWSWIPGRRYSNAWVVWRVGPDGYIGWAAAPPSYYWSGGVAVLFVSPLPAAYVFCSTRHVFSRHVHSHIVRERGEVQRAASGTRAYRSPDRHRASPSMAASHVPKDAAPKSFTSPDKRAMKLRDKPAAASPSPAKATLDQKATPRVKKSRSLKASKGATGADRFRASESSAGSSGREVNRGKSDRGGVVPRENGVARGKSDDSPAGRTQTHNATTPDRSTSRAPVESRPSQPREASPSPRPVQIAPRPSQQQPSVTAPVTRAPMRGPSKARVGRGRR